MLLLTTLLFFLCVSCMECATPNGEEFAFVAKGWTDAPVAGRSYAHVQDSFIFDCTTNDPEAKITLQWLDRNQRMFLDVLPEFGSRMVQTGQKFYVSQLEMVDTRQYRCQASDKSNNRITLLIGDLFIIQALRTVEPEIIQDAIHKIEMNGNDNITCRTHGKMGVKESYLKWYREGLSGNRILIDNSRIVRTEELASSAFIDVEILMFKNFGKGDVGKYICVRQVNNNDPTEKSISIELEDNSSPKITFPNDPSGFKSVNIGDQVIMTCLVKGSPKPNRYWKKDGQKIEDCPKEIIGDNCIHVIKQATFEKDNGKYECVGENLVKNVSKDFTLEVQVRPKLKKPTNTIIANTKEDRELLCEIEEGNPLPKFRWQEQAHSCVSSTDCKPLANEWKPVTQQFPNTNTEASESSIIAKATTTIFFYRCIATNKASSDNHIITVYRKDEAPPQFQFESNKPVLNEKEKLILKCTADIYVFRSIEIQKDGKSLKASLTQENQTIIMTFEVPQASLINAGKYACIGRLKRGSKKQKEVDIIIKKITVPVIIGFDDVTISQDQQKHHSLICQATGNPKPKITWSRKNVPVQGSTISDKSRCNSLISGIYFLQNQEDTLIFCSLDFRKHAGQYECKASNSEGVVTDKMTLTITAKPVIKEWSNETLFGVGSEEKLTCKSEAYPTANVSWIHTSSNSTTALARGVGTSSLILSNIDKSHQGKYLCIAQNVYGKDEKVTTVIIVGENQAAKANNIVDNKGTLTGIIIGFVAVLVIVLILVFLYRRHLKTKYALYLEPNRDFVLDPNRSLFEQSSDLPYDFIWEFPRERVNFLEPLGSGAFGQVFLAGADGIQGFKPRDSSNDAKKKRKAIQKVKRYHNLKGKERNSEDLKLDPLIEKVAIKTIKDESSESEYKDLASELKILIHLGEHSNIVNLLGACTTKGKLFVILEYCEYGNLLSFLRERRDIFQPTWSPLSTNVQTTFTYSDLVHIGCQISDGMNFLQSKKCIHRDLAARNVLVGENYTMKIADFGLARDIYKDEFYLKETTGLLPVKWMAPESLFDRVYTTSSDVWSFGILLWEVFTLGGSPYPGLPTEELMAYLDSGARMKRPDICPKEVYSVMLECWSKSPYQRPLFNLINNKLNYILTNKLPEEYSDLITNDEKNSFKKSDTSDKSSDHSTTLPQDEESESAYISPTNNQPVDELGSAEYIDAIANGKIFSSPKGETYVPPPDDLDYENTSPVSPKTPLLSSPPYDHGYIPMTPADHYKTPSTFTYGQEAMV